MHSLPVCFSDGHTSHGALLVKVNVPWGTFIPVSACLELTATFTTLPSAAPPSSDPLLHDRCFPLPSPPCPSALLLLKRMTRQSRALPCTAPWKFLPGVSRSLPCHLLAWIFSPRFSSYCFSGHQRWSRPPFSRYPCQKGNNSAITQRLRRNFRNFWLQDTFPVRLWLQYSITPPVYEMTIALWSCHNHKFDIL